MASRSEINATLEQESEALFAALSDLGRDAFYPPDIPFQAAEARAAEVNATIGQITDREGHVVPLRSVREILASWSREELDRSLLYSPVAGFPELRQAWRTTS